MPQLRDSRIEVLPIGQGHRMEKLTLLNNSGPESLSTQAEALKELVRIIVNDRTTPGLSLIDVAAMLRSGYCFLRL